MSITVRVEHSSVTDLGQDLRRIVREAPADMRETVRQGLIVTTDLGRSHARTTARRHGKLYPRSFTWEMGTYSGFGASSYSGESGPDSSRRQGGMSFEEGSRNQPPHRDVAYAARIGGQAFAGEAAALPGKWFW